MPDVNPALEARAELATAKRLVVKIGSSSLTGKDGRLNLKALRALVKVLGARHAAGGQVVLVSSGAVAAGIAPLGLKGRPKDLATAQAAATVGQGLLVARYAQAFASQKIVVGQVLLTEDDVIRRVHYRNAYRTLNRLLDLGVVPIINENDAVATTELRFGDNDRLAALVSHLTRADALVLLTDVDGLYTLPPSCPGAERIGIVRGPGDLAEVQATGRGSSVGTGGMVTKLEAAAMATETGIPAMLTSAANVRAALDGEDVGTWFAKTGRRRSPRLLWLAHAARTSGQLVLDDGAVKAITVGKKSLLAAGVKSFSGTFDTGDVVELAGDDGTVVARGIVAYSSEEMPAALGKTSSALRRQIGTDREVVHRDYLAVLPNLRRKKAAAS